MDVCRYIHSFIIFFSWRGRSRSLIWNVRVKFATKTLLPWENGHLLPFKSREWETSACDERREPSIWFHFFWSFWKVFLFFIARVFTVQIVFTKTQDWRSYFSSPNVRNHAERRTEACASGRQRCGLEARPLVAVGTADRVLIKRSIVTERRNVSRFSFFFLFLFFFFCNFGDASPKAGLALPSTATLQRLHRMEVQNPF